MSATDDEQARSETLRSERLTVLSVELGAIA